jgi:hypothetical protein
LVILSFSVLKDKLLDGRKRQTFRPRNDARIEQMKRLGIQVYWKSRSPKDSEFLFNAEMSCHPISTIRVPGWPTPIVYIEMNPVEGYHMKSVHPGYSNDDPRYIVPMSLCTRDTLAKSDGFQDEKELMDVLFDKYGKELAGQEFNVITFNRVPNMRQTALEV